MASSASFQQTANTLSNLSGTCEDSHHGFLIAAPKVQDADLKKLFYDYAGKRLEFRMELQSFVASLGVMPRSPGSVGAALRRVWIAALGKLGNDSDHAILVELERGEGSTVAAYQEAFTHDLITDAQDLVQRQYSEIKEAHDRIRALRARYEA